MSLETVVEKKINTVEYNGRTISYDGGGAEHLIGGEGPILARHFNVQPGDVVMEVGAADAAGTLYALASGAKMVYAIEPLVPFHKKIVEDVLVNPGFYERCKVLLVGLDEVDCVKTIEQSYTQAGGSEGLGVEPEMKVPARFVTMDSFMGELESLGRLDWVKMDIEGFEWNAMKGGLAVIEKFRPNFLIENHQYVSDRIGKWMRKEKCIDHIYAYLFGLGYKIQEDTHHHCHQRSFIVATRR